MHQITFRQKKTAIRQKSILISGPCHARVITAKTFLQMCCTGCPECHAHGLRVCSEITTLLQLTAFHQNKDRERTRKTGDHFAGWDFSVDTRVQRSIYCGFRPKEVDHAWFPMNIVEFIQAKNLRSVSLTLTRNECEFHTFFDSSSQLHFFYWRVLDLHWIQFGDD